MENNEVFSIISTARQRVSTFEGRGVNFGTQKLKFRQQSYIYCIMIRVKKIVEKLGNECIFKCSQMYLCS